MFNYFLDASRGLLHDATVMLFDEIKAGKYEAYTSSYVVEELMASQEPKRTQMLDLINRFGITRLDASKEIERLAEVYISKNAVPKCAEYDSLHIATATVYELDDILSLNFKHINRLKTKDDVAYINKSEGYTKMVTICSPMEIIGGYGNERR